MTTPLSRVIQARLAALDLSKDQLADRSGLGRSTIYAFVAGTRTDPQGSTLRKLAAGLGMTPGELMAAVSDDVSESGDLNPRIVSLVAFLRHASAEDIEQVHDFARWKVQPAQRRAIGRQEESAKRREAAARKLERGRATGDDDGAGGPLLNASHHVGTFGATHHSAVDDAYGHVVTDGYAAVAGMS